MVTQEEFLKQLGLDDQQIKIYLDLASNPESTVVEIHKRIFYPRSSIYLELERLINKGFVISKKVGKTTTYRITKPEILVLTIEKEAEKLNYLKNNLVDFANIISSMEGKRQPPKTINIYKGQAGIKQLLWNIILSKANVTVGFSPGQLEDVTDRAFAEKWREEFQRNNMYNRIIFNEPKPLSWSDVPHFLEKNTEIKTLDARKIKFDRYTLIYNDIISLCSLKTDSDQYGIEIRDNLLVNSYRQIFDFLWNHVAKTLRK
jgi:sugar-specific transcriptional regulator TrmB